MKRNVIKKFTATLMASTFFFLAGIGLLPFGRKVLADGYNPGIEAFVNSLYADCLGRNADPTGFNDWCSKLASGQITGKQAAYGFFFSPEFIAKANSWSDDQLIEAYYRVFLNRSSDPAGKAYWSQQISGTTNDISILFTGFADSTEFAQKCAFYGIIVGSHVNVPTTVRGSEGATITVYCNNQFTDSLINNYVRNELSKWNVQVFLSTSMHDRFILLSDAQISIGVGLNFLHVKGTIRKNCTISVTRDLAVPLPDNSILQCDYHCEIDS